MGQSHKTTRPLKVAVVGSGLAGLTAAHVLVREASRTGEDVEVHLFEKVSARPLPTPPPPSIVQTGDHPFSSA